jgi:RNase P/RNase MRP subunit p30
MPCIDLFGCLEGLEVGRRLGWEGFCVVGEFGGGDFRSFVSTVKARDASLLAGALVKNDVSRNAKRAIESADLVFADARQDDAARQAAESWDVDLIVNPELNENKDLIHQRSSGLDHVIAAFMAERDIGYLVNFDNILLSSGARRAQLVGRISQNLMLADKYGVRVVFGSGERSRWHMRNPSDIEATARMLGMGASQARDALRRNTQYFAAKAHDRNDPDIIMRGVSVRRWGSQQRLPKRKGGWY